jgi:hypothetical protein
MHWVEDEVYYQYKFYINWHILNMFIITYKCIFFAGRLHIYVDIRYNVCVSRV